MKIPDLLLFLLLKFSFMGEELRIIVSGGGTGGHIFPAVSIANAIKARHPEADILFVGAEGRMEMQRVPAAGYPIKALPICGFDRKHLLKNVAVLSKIWKSRRMARKIIREFRPMAVVGVGGYASGPTLDVAGAMGIPTLIQEQNSYAGVTNKLLAKRADKICVAYDGMERFFPKEKIILTGNPVRQGLLEHAKSREDALQGFGLLPGLKTVLLIGGSLGARTLNESVLANLAAISASGVQFIWQTGSYYFSHIQEQLKLKGRPGNLYVTDFIAKMEDAYAAADLVISRAGAGSISELCLLGKPAILVPSPNVAEDHQTKNATALVDKQAALCVKDSEAADKLIGLALNVIRDADKLSALSRNIKAMAFTDAAGRIAEEVCKLAAAYRGNCE